MSQYPLNELKRRLIDDTIQITKRLRLAKNVVQSHHFYTAPKERVVSEWLNELMQENKLSNKELGDVLDWLNGIDDLTSELKIKLIKIVSQYLDNNTVQIEDIQKIITFLENDKINAQLHQQIDEYLFIITTLLQNLQRNPNQNIQNILLIFKNIVKYYKESKKKLEFITKFISGENLETIFGFLNSECHIAVNHLCQNILFPITKKQFYSSFLNNLIRKDNIDELIAEKGDNIQSVLKISSAFFTFPNGRSETDHKFLRDFIDTFVSSYHSESQIIFAFYIMAASALNLPQIYVVAAMKMPPIIFKEHDEKIKRNLFLNMLEVLFKNEVDLNVRLTDTLSEIILKVEVKKTFMCFLQAVLMGQLKLEGKMDKLTLNIVKIALLLDPNIIEQKMYDILPYIMSTKKHNSHVRESYIEMISCLLKTLFKLSRGIDFLNRIIPHLKVNLEAANVEQFELKQKYNEALSNNDSCDKIKRKMISGDDVFPQECVEMYGKLTSELMFRQNKELLILLQKDFEEHCLMMLEEGFVSPSIIILSEVLCSILSSFFHHNKMADHTVPMAVAREFWIAFQDFEKQCLNKFGDCILNLNYNPPLIKAFMNLCISYCHLKLLNIKYSNTKLEMSDNDILPFLDRDEWIRFSSNLQDDELKFLRDNLLIIKTIAKELSPTEKNELTTNITSESKTNLIKQIYDYPQIFSQNKYFTSNLIRNIDNNQLKLLSKTLIKSYINYQNIEIFKNDAIINNKELLQAIVLKVAKNLSEFLSNAVSLNKVLSKSNFNIISFANEIDIKELFNNIEINNEDEIINLIEIFKHVQIYYLDENCQLTTILILLLIKKFCQTKKLKRTIDYILLSIFELSPKYPDLYKIFPLDFIFNFREHTLIDLLKLTNKTSNNMLIVKSLLEIAVKKVKTDSEIVKHIVDILLTNHEIRGEVSNVDYFKDPVFQTSCIILPLIAKEKKAITTSAFRSILANLQDKLNKAMLNSFTNIKFSNNTISDKESGDADNSMLISDNTMAILNAMSAYSLTLLKCCESTDAEDIKNLNCLWSGLEFFVHNAIQALQNPSSKNQQIESSVHLLNVTLRYIKKLETHEIFHKKDELFRKIWQCVKSRLILVYNRRNNKMSNHCLEEIAITLKFLAELSSVECFNNHFISDLSNLALLKKPSFILKNSEITNSQLTTRRISKIMWQNCLKANIIGPKCIALTKLIFRATRNIKCWIQQHYDYLQEGEQQNVNVSQYGVEVIQNAETNEQVTQTVKLEDSICELLRYDLDVLCEIILAAKKISLDYKFLDSIFELQHLMHYILGRKTINVKCDISWEGFVYIYQGCVATLNNLLLSREEILEDRWPCYMQCYKTLVLCLCERAISQPEIDTSIEHKLSEMAHSVEKLTQSICKRKTHVSRIAAYAVADLCTWLEHRPPPKMVRQHLENAIALLIQVSDSTYAMAFLRRALAGSVGQMTMTKMYTMYKRYHKYVGNA